MIPLWPCGRCCAGERRQRRSKRTGAGAAVKICRPPRQGACKFWVPQPVIGGGFQFLFGGKKEPPAARPRMGTCEAPKLRSFDKFLYFVYIQITSESPPAELPYPSAALSAGRGNFITVETAAPLAPKQRLILCRLPAFYPAERAGSRATQHRRPRKKRGGGRPPEKAVKKPAPPWAALARWKRRFSFFGHRPGQPAAGKFCSAPFGEPAASAQVRQTFRPLTR